MSEAQTNRFRDFDMAEIDDYRAMLSLVRTCIDVAIDYIDHQPNKASDLMHCALSTFDAADAKASSIQADLSFIHRVEAANG